MSSFVEILPYRNTKIKWGGGHIYHQLKKWNEEQVFDWIQGQMVTFHTLPMSCVCGIKFCSLTCCHHPPSALSQSCSTIILTLCPKVQWIKSCTIPVILSLLNSCYAFKNTYSSCHVTITNKKLSKMLF